MLGVGDTNVDSRCVIMKMVYEACQEISAAFRGIQYEACCLMFSRSRI
jgi:hypothetical protein